MSSDPLLWYLLYKETEEEHARKRAEKTAKYASFKKEEVQAVMHSKKVKKADKVALYGEISWKQRIFWFPKITLIYTLITGTIGYLVGLMIVSWLGL